MPEEKISAFLRLTRKAVPVDPALRVLSLATLVNTFGNGLFMTIEIIYFTQHVGLSPTSVAFELGIAGGVAVLFSVPAGHLADRFGPRDIACFACAMEGGITCLFYVGSFIYAISSSLSIHRCSRGGRTNATNGDNC